MELAGGESQGGLGLGVVGILGEETTVGLLGVGEVAGAELGLAKKVLGLGGFGVEGDGLLEWGDGGVVLVLFHVGDAETETSARISRRRGPWWCRPTGVRFSSRSPLTPA